MRIQSAWRGFFLRCSLARLAATCTVIQRCYRGHLGRQYAAACRRQVTAPPYSTNIGLDPGMQQSARRHQQLSKFRFADMNCTASSRPRSQHGNKLPVVSSQSLIVGDAEARHLCNSRLCGGIALNTSVCGHHRLLPQRIGVVYSIASVLSLLPSPALESCCPLTRCCALRVAARPGAAAGLLPRGRHRAPAPLPRLLQPQAPPQLLRARRLHCSRPANHRAPPHAPARCARYISRPFGLRSVDH